MTKPLHEALACLRPKDFSEVPIDDLKPFLTEVFSKAEFITNSVPPPPGGSPFESSTRTRTDPNPATSAADLTNSSARRPAAQGEQAKLQEAWGKPLKLSAKDNAVGMSVYKMAANDRHGAWFARSSIHEGLGFAKFKKAMIREFPESLAVEGGPGEGNVRGIGGDKRLEEVEIEGVGKMEVYQLSAQFPGPTSPREFITLLLTSDNGLSDSSKINNKIPRHYIVVSIPVDHPEAPPRNGLIRGTYESVEMIREIPLGSLKSRSTTDLTKEGRTKSRDRGGTIGFAESRGPDAKGERIDRGGDADENDPERNPVEWIMITRSDPGGGIPRFMVERSTPASIVQDAVKFLNWACKQDEAVAPSEMEGEGLQVPPRKSVDDDRYSMAQSNAILAGVGTSIADNPRPLSYRRPSEDTKPGILQTVADGVAAYIPHTIAEQFPSLQRSTSHSSSTTDTSSVDSFASAEQYKTAEDIPGQLRDNDSSATHSVKFPPLSPSTTVNTTQNHHQTSRELQKIEQKTYELQEKIAVAMRERSGTSSALSDSKEELDSKAARELERAAEKHERERKKQEEKFQRQLRKLEQKREKETQKLLARREKEENKQREVKVVKERDEWKEKALKAEKEKAELTKAAEKERTELRKLVADLQRENTALVAKIGKTEVGIEILKSVKEELLATDGRARASSSASSGTGRSIRGRKSEASEI